MKFQVSVSADVPVGPYDLRIVNKFGVSNPRAFTVSDQIEVVETDKPHADIAEAQKIELGSTVNGFLANPTDVDYYTFTGKANDRVIISCLTSSIDSKARPQIEVYDSGHRKLGLNRNYKENDALVDVTLPAEGVFFVRVAEFAYQAATAEYFYRLTVSRAPWIDAVFPPVIPPGQPTRVTLLGRHLPGGKPLPGATIEGCPVESLDVTITPPADPAARVRLAYRGPIAPARALLDGFEYSLKGPGGSSNLVPIYFTDSPVVLEKEAGNDKAETPQDVTVPCTIAGRIDKRGDRDWYCFTAKKGEVYYFELAAERMGYELDTYYVVKNPTNMGNVVEEQDDDQDVLHPISFFNRNADPASVKFTAPADGKYLVMVGSRDSSTNFGPRSIYTLHIRKPAPDFRAVVMAKSRDLPLAPLGMKSGEVALDVFIQRSDGFAGPITVTAENLPGGVTAKPATIGTGSKWGTLVLSVAESAAEFTGTFTVKCTATIDGKLVSREARPATITWGVQPGQNIPTFTRLDQALYLAVRPDKAYMRLTAEVAAAKVKTKDKDNKDIEAAATFPLYVKPGDKLTLPVKLLWQSPEARPNPVNVILEPTQANMQNAAIGVAAPVPIAKDKNDALVTVDIRANAVPGVYPVVLRGDTAIQYVRDPNKKDQKTNATVSAFTEPLQVIVLPTTLGKFTATPPAQPIKAGTTGEILVKVERSNDFAGEYLLTLNLPKDLKGVTVGTVKLPAGADEVKVPVVVAADTKPGPLANLSLVAVGTVHQKFPISHEIKVNLQIAAAK